ncbi:MarR family winged helix-turn-helix transcriptional regulator [Suttonella indologenes]|uniref:Multiple antibiotic resistance protein marR n=1 Tax=Suttonella indologenes TaxID=13276 RepID=A0A380MJX6_9GAMM|nr:MarR family transcriptional regulator [Suttonella indologenes]SUO92023.1 Multiple antibiotic resistance protein marR [Suttonella indologenes]
MIDLSLQSFEDALKNIREHIPDYDYQPGTLLNFRLLQTLSRAAYHYYDTWLAQYDMSTLEYFTLTLLYGSLRGYLTPSEISDILSITRTGATRLGDRLVSTEWVVREISAEDRRSVKLRITEEGRKLMEQITPQLSEVRKHMWQDLSEEEIQIMERGIRKLIQRLENTPFP